jgi:transketolase
MRKQFVKSMKNILYGDNKTILLLGDIGVFGFREELKNIPHQVYNIGILEQSTVSLAAGMARGGMIPFIHTIAPFVVERALEQIKIDFGYQELNGNIISVGASYDYAGLGCTHHCPGDIQILMSIPNINIFIPGSSEEFDILLKHFYLNSNPKYFRLSEYENENTIHSIPGNATVLKNGSLATIIVYGPLCDTVLKACENLDVCILYYNSILPFDTSTLTNNFNEKIIVCEPFYCGSTNYLINNALVGKKYSLFNIGVPRQFLYKYGDKKQHDEYLMLDVNGIRKRVEECLV